MDVTAQRDPRGDAMPAGAGRIEVHVGELKQLYHSMDPAPFRERDLDPKVEEFIVDSAQRAASRRAARAGRAPVRQAATGEDVDTLRQAVREYFAQRATVTRARLRRLFRIGRWALLIIRPRVRCRRESDRGPDGGPGRPVQLRPVPAREHRDRAWVALWRPLEIFLYDWWPILGEARLYDRLSAMQVQVVDAQRSGATTRPSGLTPSLAPGAATPRNWRSTPMFKRSNPYPLLRPGSRTVDAVAARADGGGARLGVQSRVRVRRAGELRRQDLRCPGYPFSSNPGLAYLFGALVLIAAIYLLDCSCNPV